MSLDRWLRDYGPLVIGFSLSMIGSTFVGAGLADRPWTREALAQASGLTLIFLGGYCIGAGPRLARWLMR